MDAIFALEKKEATCAGGVRIQNKHSFSSIIFITPAIILTADLGSFWTQPKT